MSATELNAPSANLSGSASVAANNNNKPVPVKTVLLGKWNGAILALRTPLYADDADEGILLFAIQASRP